MHLGTNIEIAVLSLPATFINNLIKFRKELLYSVFNNKVVVGFLCLME
jgi:hypothetical protein